MCLISVVLLRASCSKYCYGLVEKPQLSFRGSARLKTYQYLGITEADYDAIQLSMFKKSNLHYTCGVMLSV